MSLENSVKQNCPFCNIEQDVLYYQSVNVTLQPELKSKVLSGKLNMNSCINCGKDINIVSGFLYHDMKLQLMLELSLGNEENNKEAGKEKLIQKLITEGYIYRKVNTYSEIVEKIKIFDNNLNDNVIESVSNKLKSMLTKSLKEVKESADDIEFNVIFNKIEKSIFKQKISFHFFSHPSQVMELKYDFKNLTPQEKKDLRNMDKLRNKKK